LSTSQKMEVCMPASYVLIRCWVWTWGSVGWQAVACDQETRI